VSVPFSTRTIDSGSVDCRATLAGPFEKDCIPRAEASALYVGFALRYVARCGGEAGVGAGATLPRTATDRAPTLKWLMPSANGRGAGGTSSGAAAAVSAAIAQPLVVGAGGSAKSSDFQYALNATYRWVSGSSAWTSSNAKECDESPQSGR
jgi:hypothetical protein